jgi:tetratricopeptide (TPR) repeat protein
MNDSETELERLVRSGNEHCDRKEYSIAVECYREALVHGMKAHSPLFKFGYSLAQMGNHAEAVQIYQRAISAGSGASAHNNLGCSLQQLGKHQEARDAYRKAAQDEPSDALYWRNLAARLAHLKEKSDELKVREQLVTCSGSNATDWNLLGIARESTGDLEYALVAYRRAAYENPEECAFFYNIALMNERLGRVFDAYHACRHSLKLNDAYENSVKTMKRVESALKKKPSSTPPVSNKEYKFVCTNCDQSISANISFAESEVQCPTCTESFTAPPWQSSAPKEIGPHDYINPYVLLNFNEIDEQPEAYEWFDQPAEWEELLGSLTRRRRVLKAELELNDGVLSWLPKLSITEEVVHRVLGDLDDEGWHADHWAIFRMPLLKQFLMYGDLEYFYSREYPPYPLIAEIAGADVDDYEHEDFIEFISPIFRHKLATAIKSLLDASNYENLVALFATRLPITAIDFDEVLEPVRRHFAHRKKILSDLETELETASVINTASELKLATEEAKFLNMLPAQHGEKLREDMCRAYRSISIALANHRDDYTTSNLALKAAETFKVSETTKGRLTEDRSTIDGLIQREKKHKQAEEDTRKRHTLKMTLKSWFRERTLEISPTHFCWDGESISAEKIKAIRFGITINYTNGAKTGCNSILAVHDMNGKVVATEWLGEYDFPKAVQSVLGLYSPAILTRMISAIERGEIVNIGSIRAEKKGIVFETGIFSKTLRTIPWNHVVSEHSAGSISISSKTDAKASKSLSAREDWNACMITTLVEIMKSSSK